MWKFGGAGMSDELSTNVDGSFFVFSEVDTLESGENMYSVTDVDTGEAFIVYANHENYVPDAIQNFLKENA
jgi:hypothetical protein